MLLRTYLLWISLLGAIVGAFAADMNTVYRLGPGDEFTVTVLRHTELSGNYIVPPDGIIDFPRAGRINVTGKATTELAEALKTKFNDFLLDAQVSVLLTRARIKNASIIGPVAKPGPYPITDTTRISDLIALAGDIVGDQKELTATLKRGNTVIAIDLPAVLSGAKPEANILILEGDQLTIIAPTRITVVVIGQVKNPNPFKLRIGSTPVDALAAAGDVTNRPERLHISLIRGAETIKLTWGDTTTKLQDGDVIQVENESVVRVTVNGNVRNPGGYDLLEGGGVMEALALAGGVTDKAALTQITILRAHKPENEGTEHVDLSQAFAKGIVTSNPKLAPGDQVLVPEWNAYVSVFGMVNNAGKIPISESTPFTVLDALSSVGVNNKNARLSDVTVVRIVDNKPQQFKVNVQDILKNHKYEQNIRLKPGDIVYVPDRAHSPSDILQMLYQAGILFTVL